MSQFIKFYFTSSMLNMFQTLIHPSSGAATFLLFHHIGCVFCKGDGGGIRVAACHTDTTPTSHIETPTHIETRTHNQCGDTIAKLQTPDDGRINVQNMLSTEEVK